ncbi:MAG: hypothetical protein WCF65_08590 [Parachlamydiaceae bacterium]
MDPTTRHIQYKNSCIQTALAAASIAPTGRRHSIHHTMQGLVRTTFDQLPSMPHVVSGHYFKGADGKWGSDESMQQIPQFEASLLEGMSVNSRIDPTFQGNEGPDFLPDRSSMMMMGNRGPGDFGDEATTPSGWPKVELGHESAGRSIGEGISDFVSKGLDTIRDHIQMRTDADLAVGQGFRSLLLKQLLPLSLWQRNTR